MKIQIASDLHLEFGHSPIRRNQVVGDVLVLAGDIATSPRHLVEKLRHFVPKELPVICVLGNHEFYDHDWNSAIGEYRNALDHSGIDVHLLENESIEINGVRFLGTTLWTDFFGGKSGEICEEGMADFFLILKDGEPLKWPDVASRHKESREWLSNELNTPFPGPTIVVTHHAPSVLSQHPRWAGSTISGAFFSNLDELIEETGPALWIHGHTHDSCDYKIGKTRVICNPFGYVDIEKNWNYKADFVVEV